MRFCKKMIFLFVVFAIAFMTVAVNVSAASDVTGFAYNITTQFGEDASTEANINFNSNTDKAYVEYTLATDTDFANAIKVEGDKKQLGEEFGKFVNDDVIEDTRYYVTSDYNYEVYLKELKPGTQYMYRVTDGSQKSDVFKFTTATGNSDAFTFVYINDPQLYSETGANKYYECLDLAQAMAIQNRTPIQFVLGGGDMVESGGDAYYWNKLLSEELYKEVQYMATSGNHEFTGLQSYLGIDGRFYCASVNNPKNGVETYGDYSEVSCYYKYNDTLFIQLCSSGSQRKTQVEWVEKVLAANTSQFVIVNIHYPVVSNATDNVQELIPVFDKYGVDLVLYGHTHNFAIQENYYNWKKSSVDGLGTTYQSNASSEKNGQNDAIYALVTVSKDMIQVKNYNRSGAQLQSLVLKAKRTSSFELPEFDKEKFKNSVKVAANFDDQSKATLSWDKSGYNNVEYINLYDENGSQIASNCIFGDVITTYEFGGLELNKQYKLQVEIVYSDGSSEKIERSLNTEVVYGELVDLVEDSTSSRFRLQYTPKFKSEVKSLKVYVNDKEVATASVKDKRILISLSEFTEGVVNTVKVAGVLADGKEVSIYETTYGEDKSAELEAKKDEVEAEIKKLVEAVDKSKYTESVLAELQAFAVEVVNKIEAAKTVEEAEALVALVADYIKDMKQIEVTEADKTEAINKLAELVAALNQDEYAEDVWQTINNTLTELSAVISKATTKAELKAAQEALEQVIANSEKLPEAPTPDEPGDPTPDEPVEPEDPTQPVEPEDPTPDEPVEPENPDTPEEPKEEKKGGCGSASIILFMSFSLLGICIIRRKQY